MKQFILLLLSSLLCVVLWAQSPQGFSYQAVARDGQGALMTNKNINVRISILSGGASGTVQYAEVHAVQTNDYGLFNLEVGAGTIDQGDFTTINWGSNSHFLKVELDVNAGVSFTEVSTTQLLSVPYALHAASADNVDDADADPTNELQTLSKAGNQITISSGNTITLNDDNATNELQSLSKNLDTISLSGAGGKVVLEDDDATNEIQTLFRSGDTIKLTLNGGQFIDQKNDADFDPTNEIQTLSKSGNIISLTNGGFVTDDFEDADADSTNELQNLTRQGTKLILSITNDTVDAPESYALKYIICVNSTTYPSTTGPSIETAMVGEIKLFGGNFAPSGWAFCEGQVLPIISFQTLFSVIGNTYGGDGVNSFQLPNLIDKAPIHKP